MVNSNGLRGRGRFCGRIKRSKRNARLESLLSHRCDQNKVWKKEESHTKKSMEGGENVQKRA